LELLAPLNGPSPLDAWLEKGVKFYHLAYLTEDLEGTLRELCSRRAKTVAAPVPAVAFGGRRIAFVLLPGMAMVELIEASFAATDDHGDLR
jgi:methylmalonyl-CoA/ethylmalonyl-CoA epimerase